MSPDRETFEIQAVRSRLRVRLRAVAAAGVDPVLLDQEVARTERHVRLRTIGLRGRRAEGPGALVGVLVTAAVIPGVEVGVARRFFQLVRDDRGHAVRAGVAVRTSGLRRARRGTAVRVANERELEVDPADRAVRVPAAVLGTEPA